MPTPPRVRWTFHGTATVRSYEGALAWLGRFCGCRALEYSDNSDPLVARKGGVTWLGDNGLELMEPNDPNGGPGRFLDRFGPGLYALALQVEDVQESATWLRDRGADVVGETARGFIFSKPQHTCSLYLEWSDARFEFDPRFGGALPPPPPDALIDVPRIAYWGALVADPDTALDRLQQLWPAPVLFQRSGAAGKEPAVALSLMDGALVLYRLPDDPRETQELWGLDVHRPRLHVMALRVRDLSAAADTLERAGVRRLRGDPAEGEFLTHPDDTWGIPLAWTDRDLPGDPRGALS